jgi:hypothetical protein
MPATSVLIRTACGRIHAPHRWIYALGHCCGGLPIVGCCVQLPRAHGVGCWGCGLGAATTARGRVVHGLATLRRVVDCVADLSFRGCAAVCRAVTASWSGFPFLRNCPHGRWSCLWVPFGDAVRAIGIVLWADAGSRACEPMMTTLTGVVFLHGGICHRRLPLPPFDLWCLAQNPTLETCPLSGCVSGGLLDGPCTQV